MSPEASAILEQLRQENQALRPGSPSWRRPWGASRGSGNRSRTNSTRPDVARRDRPRPSVAPIAPRSPTTARSRRAQARTSRLVSRTPTHVDEHAEVPLGGCPCCGGPLARVEPVEQCLEDLPPRRPHVTRIVTYKATCSKCGEVRSTHPLQMSEATGAAKVQLGPRAWPWPSS